MLKNHHVGCLCFPHHTGHWGMGSSWELEQGNVPEHALSARRCPRHQEHGKTKGVCAFKVLSA